MLMRLHAAIDENPIGASFFLSVLNRFETNNKAARALSLFCQLYGCRRAIYAESQYPTERA
jgi:hypothetical protein